MEHPEFKLTLKHIELLIDFCSGRVAKLTQLSATKQKIFLDLAASGCLAESSLEDEKYINITSKGLCVLNQILDSAKDVLLTVGNNHETL